MSQVENWLQFAYAANLLERKQNYIKKAANNRRGNSEYLVVM